jgi:uncharacterized repeat protein (TIGR03837 family)
MWAGSALMRWDIFCRVVDNFGDMGVCWRLANQLVNTHGRWTRLWVDDWIALRQLLPDIPMEPAPCLVDGVEVFPWALAEQVAEPGACVIEAFGCTLPDGYLTAMRAHDPAPAWINLEYLSAEAWIEDCHGLPSPDPGTGLAKYFFFPGFTEASGGLLREPELLARRDAARGREARPLWLARHGVPGASTASRWVSLFCYHNPALPGLLDAWQSEAVQTLLWVPAGIALRQVGAHLGRELAVGQCLTYGSVQLRALPFLPMRDYDALLALCDVNFVRGEDSFVRAQWAARPLVWQAYPQAEAAHLDKVAAFLARYQGELPAALAAAQQRLWQAWNDGGDAGAAWLALAPALSALDAHAWQWCASLARQKDLAERLVNFIEGIVK